MQDLASPRARAVPSRTEIAARLATHPPLETLLTADDLEKQQLAAEKRLQEVQDLVSAQQKLVAEYSTHAQRREALETQLQQADAALADADAKLRDALLNADTAGPEVKLVQPARAPSQPIYPNRLLMLLMAPGVGALAGVLIVILESTLR